MGDGTIRKMFGRGPKSKTKSKISSGTKIDGGTLTPILEDNIKGNKRKAVILLVQQEQNKTWHTVARLEKPAVNGLVFEDDDQTRLFILDTSKTWLYDENNQPIVIFDITNSIPATVEVSPEEKAQGFTEKVAPQQSVPEGSIKVLDNEKIDSKFTHSILVKEIVTKAMHKTVNEEPHHFDWMTAVLLVIAVVAGISVGYTLGQHYAAVQTITTTVTTTAGGLSNSSTTTIGATTIGASSTSSGTIVTGTTVTIGG